MVVKLILDVEFLNLMNGYYCIPCERKLVELRERERIEDCKDL